MKIAIINGPNLNLLGTREPDIYGNLSFTEYLKKLQGKYQHLGIEYFQSNVEGELINYLHQAAENCQGIILNAGAYTHTSVAIADAVAAIKTPVIEVHISNTYAREEFRHRSYIAPKAAGVIVGFGFESYRLALDYFTRE
jgi:3-dehydroquinate dehydratase-2